MCSFSFSRILTILSPNFEEKNQSGRQSFPLSYIAAISYFQQLRIAMAVYGTDISKKEDVISSCFLLLSSLFFLHHAS